MSRVVITARTRIKDRDICLGGIDLDSMRTLRLSTAQSRNFTNDSPFHVGSSWIIDYTNRPNCIAPHMEDVNVDAYTHIADTFDFSKLFGANKLELRVWRDGPETLFDGVLTSEMSQARTLAGGLYVFQGGKTPSMSLGYWSPNRDLRARRSRRHSGRVGFDVYYIDDSGTDGTVRIVHSGFEPLPPTIPVGSMLSLSLARWWRPRGDSDQRERCALQICDLLF